MSMQLRHSLYLLGAALIWGFAFVVQSTANSVMGPFMFTFSRNMVAMLVLIPLAMLYKKKSESTKLLLIAGTLSGLALGVASGIQQLGMLYTTPGKAGFITVMYIILVPIAGLLFKKKCSKLVWLAAALSLVGVYLLCVKENFTVNKGDVIEFFCAVAFTVQILCISYFSPKVNVYKFACLQMLISGITSLIIALFAGETLNIEIIRNSWQQLLYMGIMSSGVAYTLQILGQKNLNPTIASIIMSLESCIAALAGWLILGDIMSIREVSGCIVMLAAIIIAQLKQE